MKNREILLEVNSDDDIRRIRYVGVNHYTLSFYDKELIFFLFLSMWDILCHDTRDSGVETVRWASTWDAQPITSCS